MVELKTVNLQTERSGVWRSVGKSTICRLGFSTCGVNQYHSYGFSIYTTWKKVNQKLHVHIYE